MQRFRLLGILYHHLHPRSRRTTARSFSCPRRPEELRNCAAQSVFKSSSFFEAPCIELNFNAMVYVHVIGAQPPRPHEVRQHGHGDGGDACSCFAPI